MNKIVYNNGKNIISNKLLKRLHESVKRHINVLTRAQKKRLEEEHKKKQREERKETEEEEQIWNEMKEEIFKFNDKIAIQAHVYETLWGARSMEQLTNLVIFR